MKEAKGGKNKMEKLREQYEKEVIPALMKNSNINQLCKFQNLTKLL